MKHSEIELRKRHAEALANLINLRAKRDGVGVGVAFKLVLEECPEAAQQWANRPRRK